MKIYIHQIPQGDSLYLDGEEDPVGLGLEEIDIRPLSPLSYNLQIGLSEGGLFAVGQLRILVELQCVVSLDRFPYEIDIPDFATQIELHGREYVDLTPTLREDILLRLPTHPRKPESEIDPAYVVQSPDIENKVGMAWSVLQGFKPKKSKN